MSENENCLPESQNQHDSTFFILFLNCFGFSLSSYDSPCCERRISVLQKPHPSLVFTDKKKDAHSYVGILLITMSVHEHLGQLSSVKIASVP